MNIYNALIQPRIVKNAIRVSVAVGTLLNLINQGSAIVSGMDIVWAQVILNYTVPYCVASYSAARNEVERQKNEKITLRD